LKYFRPVDIHGVFDRDSELKIIHPPQKGGKVIDLVHMGPQTNFAGQQIQHILMDESLFDPF
jgi:hypothetical protein